LPGPNRVLKHPVPASLLAPIGEVNVCFALLESELQAVLTSLIREHQRVGQIISSYLSFSDLRAAVLSLYRDRYGEDEDYSKLKELVSRAGKIEEERNRIVHSIWAAGDSAQTIMRVKVTARQKRGYRADFEQYDQTRLEGFITTIKEVVETTMKLRAALVATGKLFNNPPERLW
jgi:hypothetical protein